MSSLTFKVDGLPPAKSEAKSMLSDGHRHSERVRKLLTAAGEAASGFPPHHFGEAFLGLELVLTHPVLPPSDATNYLGGVGDVLENKSRRSGINGLGELAHVALYENDQQIQEVRYRWSLGDVTRYTVTLWDLNH